MNATIHSGDCLEVLKTFTAESSRLVFVDPPYNLGIDYGLGKNTDRLPIQVYLDRCREWMSECVRILTPNGSIWVLISEEWVCDFGVMLRQAGLHRRRIITWYETFGNNCRKNFNRTSRFLLYFTKNPIHYVFNSEAVNQPSARQLKYNDKRANPNGKNWDSVWQINRVCGTHKERLPIFPTQLPLALLRPIIGCSSNPKDLVVDPMCGSGTTGVVCKKLGRNFVGIEQNTEYAAMASARISSV